MTFHSKGEHNGLVQVYDVGDTSCTRCEKIIRSYGDTDDIEFIKEFNLCNDVIKKSLRIMYKHYRSTQNG